MGCKMSCLRPSKPKAAEESSDVGSPSFTKPNKCRPKRSTVPDNETTRYEEKGQHLQMMSTDSLTLDDCLLDSPAAFKSPREKIRPSSPRRLISKAKDSMCLDRPMMMMMNNKCKQEEDEEECLSVISGKEEVKSVRFKLPHVLILYSPSEEESPGYYRSTSSEDSSFYLTLQENCRGGSFESPDEICFRLAVNTLPRASFSSGF